MSGEWTGHSLLGECDCEYNWQVIEMTQSTGEYDCKWN